MQFNSLKASIANNADQQPTIYMALCMIESLFDDMEDAFGDEISHGPIGDDTMPNKLIWLCNAINGIYSDNKDDLTRNRVRLDAAIKKLRQSEQDLQTIAQDAEQLSQAQRKAAALEQLLQQAQQKKQAYEATVAKCSQLQADLENIQKFDPDAAQAELTRLQNELSAFGSRKQILQEKLEATKAEHRRLQQEVEALHSAQSQAQGGAEQLNQKIAALKKEIEIKQPDIAQLRAAEAALIEEKNRLCAEQETKSGEIIALQNANEAYRMDTLEPTLRRVEEAKKHEEALKQQKESADQQYKALSEAQSNLILEIARIRRDCDSLSADNELKKAECTMEAAEKDRLEQTRSAAVSRLSDLQQAVKKLKETQIPESRKLLVEEQQRVAQLEADLKNAKLEREDLEKSADTLKPQIEEAENNLKAIRDIYDALTASYTAKTEELKDLEEKLKELQDKSDKEKLAIYKRQLEANISELRKLEVDCEDIAAKNAKLVKDIEAAQGERARLLEQKKKHETGKSSVESLLQQLQSVATEEYAREVTRISNQLSVLEMVRGKLSASFELMRKTLGHAPFSEDISLEDQVKAEINGLKTCTEDLRASLVRCANSLKMEEQ